MPQHSLINTKNTLRTIEYMGHESNQRNHSITVELQDGGVYRVSTSNNNVRNCVILENLWREAVNQLGNTRTLDLASLISCIEQENHQQGCVSRGDKLRFEIEDTLNVKRPTQPLKTRGIVVFSKTIDGIQIVNVLPEPLQLRNNNRHNQKHQILELNLTYGKNPTLVSPIHISIFFPKNLERSQLSSVTDTIFNQFLMKLRYANNVGYLNVNADILNILSSIPQQMLSYYEIDNF